MAALALSGDRYVVFRLDRTDQREAERRLAHVTRVSGVAVYQWNVVDERAEWSDEMYHLLGYEPGEVEPSVERFLSHVHPDDRPKLETATEVSRRGGIVETNRYRIVRQDGEVRTVHAHADVVTSEDGRVLYALGTIQDVTDQLELQRQAELLARSTDRLRTALEVNDGVVQGLSRVWLALEMDDRQVALDAIAAATASAQQVVAELLDDVRAARGGIRPGDLRIAPPTDAPA
jgi:PAS domain S-box-containing protein